MKLLRVPLNTSEEQAASLRALQKAFAQACNELAPIVQQTRCWNRVALHHLAYRALRERLPQIGSQMACNAIYSVSRACRAVLQHPASPWNIAKRPDAPLPLLHFLESAPVYFDRHTLSLKGGQLSMFTLDGRIRFQIDLNSEDEQRFLHEKLQEIVLSNTQSGYQLAFLFSAASDPEDSPKLDATAAELPEYLIVLPAQGETATLAATESAPSHKQQFNQGANA